MKINCKIAKIKTIKFEIKKIKYVIKKNIYKIIIKQLQVDNVVFRKVFFNDKQKQKKILSIRIYQNSNIISISFFTKFEKF